ncbi:dynamin family protein [Salipiger sp. 1_MG-2023]|uniref:dynamin family protein n=1 Tax=Salipiger sp. 1_MG-2023 TaxID=3062665 RepID=UPI0026E405A3|nr:dynamin family protein [Salipiger sp. 1_MG-2023]MDO6588395.1 dynamin family protein [Salipiger sp. 1_MG-2023]
MSTQDSTTLSAPFEALGGLADRLAAVDSELTTLAASAERSVARQARRLHKEIRSFDPAVTFIGQVKAGKTTLVNSLVGWPDLLPADVNPWTSVVTSLHLSPTLRQDERRSSFRFFGNDEWDALLQQGGRVGQLAARAGAEDELEKVRKQLEAMREKSRARLGRRFQMLLGQTHDYDSFDQELIARYVCLGDDFWEEPAQLSAVAEHLETTRERGRFADITKSADLWFGAPGVPIGLTIQDTPGVNDTFMIREQITINALRASRLCVMVLSASQALSAVDLGLIRLISNVKSRQIIIFVNRIDELNDPVNDVPKIRDSIRATLERFQGPVDAEILFGSGHWASNAIGGSIDGLGASSAEALMGWLEAHLTETLAQRPPAEIIWTMSGVPELGRAIAERLEKDAGAALEKSVDTALRNLRVGAAAREAQLDARSIGAQAHHACTLTPEQISDRFAAISERAYGHLETRMQAVNATFASRAESARRTFLGRATSSLARHLEQHGEGQVWAYDPSGLRMLLRTAYSVFVHGAGKAGTEALEQAAGEIDALLREVFGLPADAPELTAPPLPEPVAPVSLGQTIALDLKGRWWMRFWRRRKGYQAMAEDFASLIHEETAPVVEALRRDCADPYALVLRAVLAEFLRAQRDLVLGLSFPETQLPLRSAS